MMAALCRERIKKKKPTHHKKKYVTYIVTPHNKPHSHTVGGTLFRDEKYECDLLQHPITNYKKWKFGGEKKKFLPEAPFYNFFKTF